MKDKLAQVFHFDLYGKREDKYDFLKENSISSIEWNELQPQEPNYFFVQKDFELAEKYKKGFLLNDLFPICLLGPNSHRDHFAIAFNDQEAQKRIDDFANENISDEEIRSKYILKDNRDWNLQIARRNMEKNLFPVPCLYRPFDKRYMLYGSYAYDYYRPQLNDNLLKSNFGLVFTRQTKESFSVFITNKPLGQHKIATPYDGSYSSPLYLYPETTHQQTINPEQQIASPKGVRNDGTEPQTPNPKRIPNLNPEIISKIEKILGLVFVPEKEEGNVCMANSSEVRPDFRTSFVPIDLLDYIYAVLHSPEYREKYKEFLKIDFPRVPYPTSAEKFWELVKLGGELRQLHLLESEKVNQLITQYPKDGDNIITRKITKASPGYEPKSETHGKVWINSEQYFDNVSLVAWEFYIGGYQPAQKWLKDRKGRELNFEDILHYQRMIVALKETDRIMNEIKGLGIQN